VPADFSELSFQSDVHHDAARPKLTVGNQQRQHDNIRVLQPALGNSRVKRLLQPKSIQRAIHITSDQLSGKKDHKLMGIKIDSPLTSTFRAIESALDDFRLS